MDFFKLKWNQWINQTQHKFLDHYLNKVLNDLEIIWYVSPWDDCNMQWMIELIDSMIWPTLHCFHMMLGHSGSWLMHATLQAWYPHPHLWVHNKKFECDKCQGPKPNVPGQGVLPDHDIACAPCEEFTINLIGPWTTFTPHPDIDFFALTCINTTTNLAELKRILEKFSHHIATYFEQAWLSHYHQPMQVIYGNGGEFTGLFMVNTVKIAWFRHCLTWSQQRRQLTMAHETHQPMSILPCSLGRSLPCLPTWHLQTTILLQSHHNSNSSLNSIRHYTPTSLAAGNDLIDFITKKGLALYKLA